MSRKKPQQVNQNRGVRQQIDGKLPEEYVFEIKDLFAQYEADSYGKIQRHQAKSILTNFGFQGLNSKEIDEELLNFDIKQNQESFSLNDLINVITKRWYRGGRQQEGEDMYKIFDKKEKGSIGLNDIKGAFNQYLDFTISDQDILEFINEIGTDGEITFEDFATKLGYQDKS